MIKVLIVGRVTIDLNPLEVNCSLKESVTFKKYVGGSAGNIAIGLTRLGLKTAILTRVSDDQHGQFIIDYLKNENINTSQIVIDKNAQIGLTFTEILSETQSSILMYRSNAADLQVSIEDVKHEEIVKYDKVLISGTSLASSSSRSATLKILNICEEENIPIIFDLDYRPYTWRNYFEIDLYYKLIAKKASIIIGSLEEFNLMNINCDQNNLKEIANYFLNYNAKHIIIKKGAKGSFYFSNDEMYEVNILPVNVVKSFGGGDAYVSAFISCLEKEMSIIDSLFYATAHAAMLVNSHSCSDALQTLEGINNFIETNEIKKEDIVKRI